MTEQQPTCRLQFAAGSRVVATSRPPDDLAVPAPKAKRADRRGCPGEWGCGWRVNKLGTLYGGGAVHR